MALKEEKFCKNQLFYNCRYEIQPANDINFGALLINNKKEGQSRFEIHNRGEFDFKFIISKMQKEDKATGGRGNRP